MIYKINKQLILEEASKINDELHNEIRFEIQIPKNEFDKLPPKSTCERTDWYFKNHRIRKFDSKLKNYYGWQKMVGNGTVHKKITNISKQNINELDKTSDFKLRIESKRPVINGKELYLERATLSKNGKVIDVYYTSEAETKSGLKDMKLLEKIPGTKVKNIGEVSMKEMVKKKLKD